MSKIVSKFHSLVLISLVAMIFTGCFNNTNPPEYIKDVVAYKEGDGIVVYFLLSDANGQMTSAEGTYDLVITQKVSHYSYGSFSEENIELLSSRREAHIADFQSAEVGMGAFAHKALLYPIGRIRYSDFKRSPEEHGTGKVEIRFRQDGKDVMTGSTTFSL